MILLVFLQAGQFVFCTKQLSKVELYGNVKYVGIYLQKVCTIIRLFMNRFIKIVKMKVV